MALLELAGTTGLAAADALELALAVGLAVGLAVALELAFGLDSLPPLLTWVTRPQAVASSVVATTKNASMSTEFTLVSTPRIHHSTWRGERGEHRELHVTELAIPEETL